MSLLPVHFLALLWCHTIRLAGMVTILSVVWLPSASETTGQNENSILDLKIDSLSVESGDMEEALRLLRRKDYTKILIGFEKVPQWWEGKEPKNISLDVTNTTVRDILDRFCEADPRYDYEVVENVLINVFPKEARNYVGNLLNTAIQRFSVHGKHTPGGIIVASNLQVIFLPKKLITSSDWLMATLRGHMLSHSLVREGRVARRHARRRAK